MRVAWKCIFVSAILFAFLSAGAALAASAGDGQTMAGKIVNKGAGLVLMTDTGEDYLLKGATGDPSTMEGQRASVTGTFTKGSALTGEQPSVTVSKMAMAGAGAKP